MAPPSSQDEALSRYSASGEVPRSELDEGRVLGTDPALEDKVNFWTAMQVPKENIL